MYNVESHSVNLTPSSHNYASANTRYIIVMHWVDLSLTKDSSVLQQIKEVTLQKFKKEKENLSYNKQKTFHFNNLILNLNLPYKTRILYTL